MYFFLFLDYIKSCACMEVCRQVVLTMDVSFYNKNFVFLGYNDFLVFF